jgi:hypothetical protein
MESVRKKDISIFGYVSILTYQAMVWKTRKAGKYVNDSIIVYRSRNNSDDNKTYEYDMQIRSGMTLSGFVNAVLEDTDEWGIIEARISDRPIAKIRYSDGEVEDIFTPDFESSCRCMSIIGTYHVRDICKAFGKGNRMDYIVLLEEEK